MDRIGSKCGTRLPDQNDHLIPGTGFFGRASRFEIPKGFDHALALVGSSALPASCLAISSLAVCQSLANA